MPLALAALLGVVVGPVVQEYTAPTAPRYTLAAALVEHQTLELDRYRANVFIDRLELDGHLYSDKAPGQPFFSVPAYAASQLVGAEPATVVRLRGNLGLWAVTAWSSLLPAIALVFLVFAASRSLGDRAALAGTAGVTFGTLLLPYAAQLYGHVLGAALGFGAWTVVRSGSLSVRRALLGGLLAGAAVVVEYQTAIVLLAIGGWLVIRARRRLLWFALGGVPAILALALYQAALLGSPFASSYSKKPAHSEATPLVTGLPKPAQGLEILLGSRGLLLFTPVVAAGVWGLARLARSHREQRDDAIVGLGVLAGVFLLQAGWPNPWGGEMPGPRYMIPAMPFLGLGVTVAWRQRPRLVTVLAGISAFSMFWPLYARHLVPDGGWLVASQLTDVNLAGFMPTLFTMPMGSLGWVVHLALLICALAALDGAARSTRSGTPSVSPRNGPTPAS
ncbi:MAG: hypothetical protein ABIP36_01480 [Acidimicrobiales bacterium]